MIFFTAIKLMQCAVVVSVGVCGLSEELEQDKTGNSQTESEHKDPQTQSLFAAANEKH